MQRVGNFQYPEGLHFLASAAIVAGLFVNFYSRCFYPDTRFFKIPGRALIMVYQ